MCVSERACSFICLSMVPVKNLPSNFPDLVDICLCLFVAVTEYSILMQYWVGYDLDILSSTSNACPSSVSTDLSLTLTLIPLAVYLNSTMKALLKNHSIRCVNKGAKDRGPRLLWRYFFPPSQLNVFSHLSLADPLPLSPTLRCETDGGVWPLAKVNRALNCVWAQHHTPTTEEIKHCSSLRLPLTSLN